MSMSYCTDAVTDVSNRTFPEATIMSNVYTHEGENSPTPEENKFVSHSVPDNISLLRTEQKHMVSTGDVVLLVCNDSSSRATMLHFLEMENIHAVSYDSEVN
ncbi:MAG: hypothetical protein Q4G59_09360, partial [Planctomycetia bacterium]|nr:hypothetical protein [Planctomycetia bacterium]